MALERGDEVCAARCHCGGQPGAGGGKGEMKILLVTTYYTPDLGPSAPMLAMLGEDLAARGHAVTVICAVPHFPSGRVAPEYRKGLWQWEEQNGVRVCRVRVPGGDRANLRHRLWTFVVYQILATLAGLTLSYDAALITNPAIETGLPFAVLGWLRRKPCVFAVWDLYPEVGARLGIFRGRLVINVVKAMEDFCLRRAAAVQALSAGFVESLRNRVGHPEKLTVIPVWIDVDFIHPLPRQNNFSETHGLNDSFVVLYAGNLGLSQGLEQVVGAAGLLAAEPHIRFVFVGDGPNREALQGQARQKQLANVQFIPFQPRERLPEVLAAADLSLVSLQSGFGDGSLPSKTFSILASGRPFLAITDAGSQLWKLADDLRAGRWVPPGDPQAIRKAVVELSQDPEALRRMGENGRSYALQHHARQAAADRFEQLFQQILPSKKRTFYAQ